MTKATIAALALIIAASTGCEIVDDSESSKTEYHGATNGTFVVLENSDGSTQEITTDDEGNKTIVMKDSDGSVQSVQTVLVEEEEGE